MSHSSAPFTEVMMDGAVYGLTLKFIQQREPMVSSQDQNKT